MGQGRLLGLLPHGSMGYGTADLPPSCPGVLQVCSASSTVSVAVLGAELQAQGQSPQRCQWWWCRSGATTVRSHSHAQPHASPLLPVLEGLPPCQGTALLHSLGEPARAQGATCTCPLCTKAGFASSSPAAEDSTRGTKGREEQPAPSCHRQILSKKEERPRYEQDCDTVPRWEQRGCRSSGTCQAVCEGQPVPITDSLGTSGMGQSGCSLTAAVDSKEHWRPEWKIRMVLTGFRDLLGIKDACPEGQYKCPSLCRSHCCFLHVGLQTADRQLDAMSRAEQAEARRDEVQPFSG